MNTECSTDPLEFHALGRRTVVERFDGGEISSDGGGLLLREVEQRTQILRRLSQCFIDHRHPARIEHSVESLVKQRVLGIALGYEDLNDHDELCRDSVLAMLSGCTDLTGAGRVRPSDRGKPLAGKSTLNRLELTPEEGGADERYKKTVADFVAMDALLVEVFLESYETAPEEIILDVDATDDYTVTKQAAFFTGTTGIIVICRCIFSVVSSCCAPACGRRTGTGRRARWKSWHSLLVAYGCVGLRCALSCAGTVVFVVRS